MTEIIYLGTHGDIYYYPKGIDKKLSDTEYHHWLGMDNERWYKTIKEHPKFGYTYTTGGDVYYTYYAFPWSVDDRRKGSYTSLFWYGEHSEEEITDLIKSNPFLAHQFKFDL